MILQLNPPIPLETPKGKAIAHFIVDYGIEHHWLWVCFHNDGECWTWQNTDIKARPNPTFGREMKSLNQDGTIVSDG